MAVEKSASFLAGQVRRITPSHDSLATSLRRILLFDLLLRRLLLLLIPPPPGSPDEDPPVGQALRQPRVLHPEHKRIPPRLLQTHRQPGQDRPGCVPAYPPPSLPPAPLVAENGRTSEGVI